MDQFPFSDLLKGKERLFMGMQAKKTDGSMEDIKTNGKGALLTQDSGTPIENITLQSAATAAGNGTVFNVGTFKTLTLSITGTSTSRTIVFEVADTDGNYTPIQGVKLNDFAMGTQTTGTGEKWTFEVTGVTTFRARVTAVAGGNVTVKGTAVA